MLLSESVIFPTILNGPFILKVNILPFGIYWSIPLFPVIVEPCPSKTLNGCTFPTAEYGNTPEG